MKRKYPYGTYSVPSKRRRSATQVRVYRPAISPRYSNLVVARPQRMAPLATRGYRFPMNGENKTIDIAVGTVQANTTGTITLLNGCIQGTDFNQRIGRKILLKSVYIRGFVRSEASATMVLGAIASQQVRMILVVDTQPNGVVFAITDLLVSASPASQLNLNNRDRFMVICDKTWVLDPYALNNVATTSFASMSNQIKPLKKFKKLNIETIFNAGNAGTIGDMNSGALYLVWIGTEAAAAGTDANAVLSTRVRFKDP